MDELLPGVSTWSVFSEEKQINFNGFHLNLGDTCVLVDPPALSEEQALEIESMGGVAQIVITNRDHRRAAPAARERFGAPIAAPALDAPLMDCLVDVLYQDGHQLMDALRVIHLPEMKSPGESALYWEDRRILILGDSLIGKPLGALSLLPDGKFASPEAARESLTRLLDLDAETVLVGDGMCLIETGGEALRECLAAF